VVYISPFFVHSLRRDPLGGRLPQPEAPVYLKTLEIIGFKSFADRTRMSFEPGLIAIVGPNGCGKSNVSDAIRWVLGEQRPTALRCAKMSDVLFNGTDSRKPLGLAEVSITFADCEGVLDTEFNEVTITRRVYRSGEGQYFLNKTPCRLKEIHRLLMGTGIGTTSYSVMAQGQIDAILSSKPEDRRTIFEEAAGITKFKADRKEALRKLEQTEANLLRLTDVIREVKRQIGSLQRQAGKAQKFKELRDELRGIDLFVTRRRLAALDIRIRDLDAASERLTVRLAQEQDAVMAAEQVSSRIHEEMLRTEQQIGVLTESAAQADNRLLRAQEVIRVNEQRIAEYRGWAERDTREITQTRQQVEWLATQSAEIELHRQSLASQGEQARQASAEAQRLFDEQKRAIDQSRAELQQMREQSLGRERRAAQLQAQLSEMETRQRVLLMQHERLAAEHAQLAEQVAGVERARGALAVERDSLHAEAETRAEALQALQDVRAEAEAGQKSAQDEYSRLQAQLAAKRAQLDLLSDRASADDELAPGTRLILDPDNPLKLAADAVIGPLAEQFSAPNDLRLALEAALRAWLDAVVVRQAADAVDVMAALFAQGRPSAARVIIADAPAPAAPAAPAGLAPLIDQVRPTADFAPAARRLLGHVFLADTLEAVPRPLPAGCTVVTRSGAVFHADGTAEAWMPENQVSSPLARQMLIADAIAQTDALEAGATAIRKRLEQASSRCAELKEAEVQTRRQLDDAKRLAAQKDGEFQSVARDAERTRQRFDVVSRELDTVQSKTSGDGQQQQTHAAELQALAAAREQGIERSAAIAAALQELEGTQNEIADRLADARLASQGLMQQAAHAESQAASLAARSEELERLLQGRSQGVKSYDEGIARLTAESDELSGSLQGMVDESARIHACIDEGRAVRARKGVEFERADAALGELRRLHEEARNEKSRSDLELAESRMHRQNHLDRIYNDYGLTVDQLIAQPDPRWPGGVVPEITDVEPRLIQLQAEIAAMGPVNLVAIEEYKELEERYTFLRAQEDDLVKAKEQLFNLIQMINAKTSEMFKATFSQANANFEIMFTKLFNGGTARLVLMENQEDPLECGVDIIARPPGKRPQSVTLLSGGERTMTAVSLLFAIYMIKPSPFCMLDELDAALDDSNIGRFVQALKDFLAQSQFLIITHNQHTIASADIVYGVTQQDKGVSKIVSMRLREIGVRELDVGTASNEPPPTLPKPSRRARAKQQASAVPETRDEAGELPLERE